MSTPTIMDLSAGAGICEGAHPDDGGACREPIEYPTAVCPVCGTPVTWTQHPDALRRKMAWIPKDDLGKKVLAYISRQGRMRIEHFSSARDLKRWERISRAVPPYQVIEIVERCAGKKKRRGLLTYALNALEHAIAHDYVDEAPEDEPDERVP